MDLYVLLIFIGILLVAVTLIIWAMVERNKSQHYIKRLEEKKGELVSIINDAEQMVEELNKFSDYIISRMDLKNEELWKNLRAYEQKLNSIKYIEAESMQKEAIDDIKTEDTGKVEEISENSFNISSDPAIEGSYFDSGEYCILQEKIPVMEVKDKIIPFSSKYRDVIKMAEKGMDSTEIAKKLNMGKGEIQLVLELNR